MINREETIGTVLESIAEIETIQDMRHHILKIAQKLKKQYPLLTIKEA